MAWSEEQEREWNELMANGAAGFSSPIPDERNLMNIPTWEVTHKQEQRAKEWHEKDLAGRMKTHAEVFDAYETRKFEQDVRSDILLLPELVYGSHVLNALGEMDY